jgi:hypothetical protein
MTDQDRWFMLYAQIVGIQHRFRMADKAITLPPIETRTPE